ncbi:enoyl-CoA hydratase/isomerase family protein [Nocardia flavorosea]|uniref:Enoyl-CoA hydratase/isomerase family protein n=1 Tax=Nocardia flavorosea TaxID=53429 RepID=A0A846YCJ9_9NOCA|nr:enoyl-CoA hydratase/isomerase family protein [Nocardia flavorosea]NKY57326.1 enoyl-CoA hydratase/isomerase family protein [Nocardia flavorosea]
MGELTTVPAAVELTVVDDLATVTLERVDRANALDADTVDALTRAVDDAEAQACRALVIRSAAGTFCAGFDLDDVPDASTSELVWRFLRIGGLLERLQSSAMLTIAVLEGAAVGAGADLALACDMRIGTDQASLRFPGSAFGVVLGTRRLAAVIGDAAAVRLAATGDRVDAAEAHRLGLLDQLTEPPRIDAELGRLIRSAVRREPATLRALKAATATGDPAGLADLTRSLINRPDLAAAMTQFARRARPTTPREEQS